MGCSASRPSDVTVITSHHQYEVKPVTDQYAPPEPINSIMDQEVDRSHPMYLYAIFCATKLAEEYKKIMFPNITIAFGSFREDHNDYITVINELYQTLDYNEITLKSDKMGLDHEERAKDSIQELAYLYLLCSLSDDVNVTKTVVVKVAEECHRNRDILNSDAQFQVYYEDTLKMLITDLERKEIYTPSVFYGNKRFQEWLKIKDREAWRSHKRNSVVICVPKFRPREGPISNNNPYNRVVSRDSIDSVVDPADGSYCRLVSRDSMLSTDDSEAYCEVDEFGDYNSTCNQFSACEAIKEDQTIASKGIREECEENGQDEGIEVDCGTWNSNHGDACYS